MSERISRAAVLGAGVMGAGIAAHFAGAGIPVILLDVVPKNAGPKERSRLSQEAVGKALKAKPAAFFDPDAASLISCGNLEDDLSRLAGCDLVIEAVTERLDIKRSLFATIGPSLGPNTILASNTSGISAASMAEAMSAELAHRFVILHFFNPVRYMKLVEVVPGPQTSDDVIKSVAALGERLGKGVVFGKDTVNFVANRIGVFSMLHAIHAMDEFKMTIEEVDKIVGVPIGHPASAAFRTGDIVGVDTLLHVAKNCFDNCPHDEAKDIFKAPSWVEKMVQKGLLGQKTGAGFYKKEGANILVFDVQNQTYRPQKEVRFASLGAVRGCADVKERLKALVAHNDDAARFAWQNTARTVLYAAARVGEIADDIVNIDNAMRWGFNWELGPFEAWDAMGVADSVSRMRQEKMAVPAWVDGMLKSGRTSFYGGSAASPTFYDVNKRAPVAKDVDIKTLSIAALAADKRRLLRSNTSASLFDAGDGCVVFCVHTKMNTIDVDVLSLLEQSLDIAERNHRALVLGNDGEHFGAGFNLKLLVDAIGRQAWGDIEAIIRQFQAVSQRLRYAQVPCVSAPFQYTFGGALELSMAAVASQAYAESYCGLVEAGVGLVPGGGGCLRLLERATCDARKVDGADLLPFVGAGSLQIALAKVSTGAEDARRMFYLRQSDGVSLARETLLADAKAKALGLYEASFRPPLPPRLKAAGLDAARTIAMRAWAMQEGGFASEHDALVASKVAHVLCGGNVGQGAEITEQHVLDLEREAFLFLCGHPKTQARIQSMMQTGKPMRN